MYFRLKNPFLYAKKQENYPFWAILFLHVVSMKKKYKE